MNNKLKVLVSVIAMSFIMVGCGSTQTFKAVPQSTNAYFSATFTPSPTYNSFVLSINNKTNQDLEIDWNKTLYIKNGATYGTFMFEGVVFKDRNNQKSPDLVFANSTFKKTIYPNNLVSFSSGKYGGWRHAWVGDGRLGIYLNVKVKGKEVKRKIYVDIYRKQK